MSDKTTASSGAEESWKRGEMAAFESPAAADAAGPATPPAAPQVDNAALLKKVQQLREAAQKRGHDEGYAAGHVQGLEAGTAEGDRKRVVEGKSVSERVDLGGRRYIKKKNNIDSQRAQSHID